MIEKMRKELLGLCRNALVLKIMKTKKTLIAIGSVVALLAVIATASFVAIFANRERTDTSINTGVIDVKLVETFEPEDPNDPGDPDDGGLKHAVKKVHGVNEGTQPAYVRVRLFSSIEVKDEDTGEWAVHGGIPVSRIHYEQKSDAWVDGGDGFLYYKFILEPGEETEEILVRNMHLDFVGDNSECPVESDGSSCKMITNDSAGDLTKFKNDKIRINMLVSLESCQASNELYKLNWGLDKLPSQVEQ